MNPGDPIRTVIDSALNDIQLKTGFRTLMVTRTMDNDWVAYRVLDTAHGLHDGHVFRWSDSICSRRMKGLGPEISEDVETVPAYREAPIREQYPCRSYFGIPMRDDDGSLIGMFCGMDSEARTAELLAMKDALDHHAHTITALLKARLHIMQKQRATDSLLGPEFEDALTHLGNRRAWDRWISAEEERHMQTGGVGAVVVLELCESETVNREHGEIEGDYLIVRCARAISSVLRPGSMAARFGGNEFGIMLPEASSDASNVFVARLVSALDASGIACHIGLATRTEECSFEKAALIADSRMAAARDVAIGRRAA